MTRVITIALFVSLALSADTLKILGIFPYQGKSHFFVFKTYLRELVNRGHDVTVISYFPEKEPIDNYHDISLAGSVKILEDDDPAEKNYLTILATPFYLFFTGIKNCEVLLENKQVQNLLAKKQIFDVILVEQFNSDCSLGLAYKLEAPVIALTSHVLMPYHYNRLGIPNNPSYVQSHFLGAGTRPTLFQRVERTIIDAYAKVVYYVSQRIDHNTLETYIGDIPPLEDLARDIKVWLVYHNFVLTGSRLFPSNVIEVGGYHVAEGKPLTGELKNFYDEAQNGVIYVSFGSVVKSSTLARDKVEMILSVMNELPHRFVWKWEDPSLEVDKNKVFILNWLPQVDILAHPKTLAFYSHGGMLGTTEALHNGVPMVAMSLHGDQPANAASIAEVGLGVSIEIGELSKEILLDAFKTVLKPSFRENVKKLSAAWHDRPQSPMDTAIFWTEYVARHSNISFKNPASEVPTYQYYNLDVFVILITILIIWLAVLKCTFSYCCCKRKVTGKSKKS